MEGGAEKAERERICETVVEVVAQRGFPATTLAAVLERLGIGPGAFSRHFTSLEDCLAAVWDEIDSDVSARMRAAYVAEPESDWHGALRAALSAGLALLADSEDHARLYVGEPVHVGKQLLERQWASIERFAAMIDRGRIGRPSQEQPPPHIADAVAGAIWQRVTQLVLEGRSAELPASVDGMMYLAVLPYRGVAAAEAELDGGKG